MGISPSWIGKNCIHHANFYANANASAHKEHLARSLQIASESSLYSSLVA
jgi:hypothetical protein